MRLRSLVATAAIVPAMLVGMSGPASAYSIIETIVDLSPGQSDPCEHLIETGCVDHSVPHTCTVWVAGQCPIWWAP